MHILRDFELHFDKQAYSDLRGERFARLIARPGIHERFESVVAEAPSLFEPAACYASFSIAEYLHERIRLANGTRIGGGPVVEVVHGAEEIVVAVCTVGSTVDARIAEYRDADEGFQMVVLDELASWAVDQVRQQLYRHFEREAAERGWRLSAMLSPGESTWQVSDQPALFSLLDAAAIGVTLTDSCMMRPVKSLSLLLGWGSQPMGVEGLTNCDFCTIKDRCLYRDKRMHG